MTIAREPFALDVWCDSDQQTTLESQLRLTGDDRRAAALLYHELGRVSLAEGDEVLGAQRLLKAYELRPQFRPTLRLARLLYRQRGDYNLVVKLLDAEARATGDPVMRAALLRRRARLLWTRLGRLEEARQGLEEALRLDATDMTTLKQLELMHLIDDDREGRHGLVLRQLESISDRPLRTALLVDLALQSLEVDPTAALETLRLADRNEPGLRSVQVELEVLYEQRGLHAELADVLVEQASNEQLGPRFRGRLLARAARVHRDQLEGGRQEAIALFRRSLELSPELGATAEALELLLEAGPPEEAVEVATRLFELEADVHARAALACQIGELQRGRDDEAAARWYRAALRGSPSYQPALEALGQLLQQRGEVDPLVKIHRGALAEAQGPRARARCVYRVAELLERDGRAEEAIAAHREALAAEPGFRPSTSALERLYTRAERWQELLQLHEETLGLTDDRERQLHLLETMSGIWQHQLGDLDNAIECHQRLLKLAPTHLPALRATARLCAEARRWRELVALSEREIALVGDTQRKVELLQRTGEVWENNVLDLDRAITCYQHALAINPEHLPALRALGRLLRQKARWAELCEMHEAEIAVSSDPEQVTSLLLTIAEIYEEELLDEDRAADTYRAVLQRKPGFQPAVAALARLLEGRDQWHELLELLEATVTSDGDARTKALRCWREGRLREERLGDRERAADDYARAARLAADLAPPRAALARLLERSGDVHQLAELLGERLELAGDPAERATLSLRLAELVEQQGELRKAATLHERALALQPSVWGLWSLAKLYQRLGLPREERDTLQRLAKLTDDGVLGASCHLAAARLTQRAGLGDPAPSYRRALALGAGEAHARRGLERALREGRRDQELADELGARLDRVTEPIEQACLLAELADLALGRGEREAAEQAYRAALDRYPGQLAALWGLGKLLGDDGRWQERAELAEREAEVLESPVGVAGALVEAAILWEERLDQVARAVPLLRQVLKIQPGQLEAYQRLHRIHAARAEHAELASLIRAQITATEDPAEVAAMFSELGILYLRQLGQQTKGTACMRRVLELDPYDVQALTVLGDLHADRGEWAEAEACYGRLELVLADSGERARVSQKLGEALLALGRPREALEAMRRAEQEGSQGVELQRRIVAAAAAAGDAQAQLAALERVAEITADQAEAIRARKEVAERAEHLDEDPRAIRALQRVLELDPLDLAAIERLAAIFGRQGNRSATARHMQASIAHHRAELGRRPFDGRLYKQLGRIFRWQRSFDQLYCACTVLNHLQLADEVEAQFWREHSARCGAEPVGALTADRYEQLVVPPPLLGPLRDLLREADAVLKRLVALEPSQLGLSRGARLAASHPMHQKTTQMAGVLDLEPFDVWVSPEPDVIDVAIFSRPALVIGSRVANNPLTAADRFHIGRALFLLAERAQVLRDRSIVELAELFAALGVVAQPACALPLANPPSPERVKALTRPLRRRDRRQLGALLPRYAEGFADFNLAALTNAMQEGANRAGLVLSGDPLVALDECGAASGATSRELGDLMLYMICDEHFALRVELGLAPGSG